MASYSHVIADCSRCWPGSHRSIDTQHQAKHDPRLDYLLDNHPRGRRRAPNISRPGCSTARSIEAGFTLSSSVCPQHGHKDSRRDTRSPPPQLAAAAGNHCRSRSPLPYGGLHQHWESYAGVYSKHNDNCLTPGDRPFSPGYGWAEPGKGWARSQSRSRSRQRPTSHRSCRQQHGTCRRNSLSRERCKKCEHKNAIPHGPDAIEQTWGDDVLPRRFDDASVPTVDGITREHYCGGSGGGGSGGGSCARDEAWAKSYLLSEGALHKHGNHDTTEGRGGVAHCQPFEKLTVSARPAACRRRSREAASRWTGVANLEEAESVKNELGCARSYNRGLRDSNSELARQVAALRSRVDAVASINSTELQREHMPDASGLDGQVQVLYRKGTVDECRQPRALEDTNASEGGGVGSMRIEMRRSGGSTRVSERHRDESRFDVKEEWTTRRERQSPAPAPPRQMHGIALVARVTERQTRLTQTRSEVHAQTQTNSELDAACVAVSPPVAMGSSPKAKDNRGDEGGVCENGNEARRHAVDGPSDDGVVSAAARTGSMKQSGSLPTTNSAPRSAGFDGLVATSSIAEDSPCDRRGSSNDLYPCQGNQKQQDGKGTGSDSAAIGCNETAKSIVSSLGGCGDGKGNTAGTTTPSRTITVEAVPPEVDAESSAGEARLFLSERERGGGNRGIRSTDEGVNNEGNGGTVEVSSDEVVSEPCTLPKPGGGQGMPRDKIPPRSSSSAGTAVVGDAETVARRSLSLEPERRSPAPFEGPEAAGSQRGGVASCEDGTGEGMPSEIEIRTGGVDIIMEGVRAPGTGRDNGALGGEAQVKYLQLELRRARRTLAAFRTATLLASKSTNESARRPSVREKRLDTTVAFARWRGFLRDTADSNELLVDAKDEHIVPVSSPQTQTPQRMPEEPKPPDHYTSNLKVNLPMAIERQQKPSAEEITGQEGARISKGSVANDGRRIGEGQSSDLCGGGVTACVGYDGRAVKSLSHQASERAMPATEHARRPSGPQQMPPLPPRTSQAHSNDDDAACGDQRLHQESAINGHLPHPWTAGRGGASSSTPPRKEENVNESTTGDIRREGDGIAGETPAGRETRDSEEWGQPMTCRRENIVSLQEQYRPRREGSGNDRAPTTSTDEAPVSAGKIPPPRSILPMVCGVESEDGGLESETHWKCGQQRRQGGTQGEEDFHTGHGNVAGEGKSVTTPGGTPSIEYSPAEGSTIFYDDDGGSNGTCSTGARSLMANDGLNRNGGAADGMECDSEAGAPKPRAGLTPAYKHNNVTLLVEEQGGIDEDSDALGGGGEKERDPDVEEGPNNIPDGVEEDQRSFSSYRRDCAVLAGTAKIVFALVALEHRRVSLRFYRWKRMPRQSQHDSSSVTNRLGGGTRLARWA